MYLRTVNCTRIYLDSPPGHADLTQPREAEIEVHAPIEQVELLAEYARNMYKMQEAREAPGLGNLRVQAIKTIMVALDLGLRDAKRFCDDAAGRRPRMALGKANRRADS